ncbi:MAG: hypothetical protein FJ298_00735 [Planctomycetes bacterium]|nr:hypothetical protein [Planctomycetota bacterium]
MLNIESGERVYELPAARPRVVGPGRREQGYLDQIERLEARRVQAEREREAAQAQRQRLAGELEWSARVERGSVRRAERLEGELRTSEEAQKRLLLALGAVQRENELLRQRVDALSAGPIQQLEARGGRPAKPVRAPRSLWQRLFGR